jgi:hypothetical protein
MPVYSDNPPLCVVHMPKCGGTWVSSILRTHCAARELNGHQWARDVTAAELTGGVARRCEHCGHVPARKMIGLLRDPADWYASLWAHALRRQPLRLAEIGGGSVNFADVLRVWTTPDALSCVRNPMAFVDTPAASGPGGLWSHAMRWWYADADGNWLSTWWLWAGRLRADLSELIGVALPVHSYPAENVGKYMVTWTDEMRAMVREADGDNYAERMATWTTQK